MDSPDIVLIISLTVLVAGPVALITLAIFKIVKLVRDGRRQKRDKEFDEPSNDDMSSAVLRVLHTKIKFINDRNYGDYTERQIIDELHKIEKVRSWSETLEDERLKNYYLDWIDYAIRNLKEAHRLSQKTEESVKLMTEKKRAEELEKKKRDDERARVDALMEKIPTPVIDD